MNFAIGKMPKTYSFGQHLLGYLKLLIKEIDLSAIILCLIFSADIALAQDQKNSIKFEAMQYYDIGSGNMSSVLNQFAIKTDSEIFYSAEIVEKIQSPGVQGTYSIQEALTKILEGTALKFEQTHEKIFLIHMVFAQSDVDKDSAPLDKSISEDIDSSAIWEIEELIVTANRRSQSIQDLAMSISALNYTDLGKRALVSMEDYLSTIPGVNQVDRGVGRNSVVIRGVSADPAFEDATVGVYFDEVPLTGRAYFGSADLKLVDMERVEILRGPQGTLYGAGSLAGAVRNIPVEPNLRDLDGKVTIGYSEMADEGSDGNKVLGIVNVPLIHDKLAFRASVYKFENSGYIKNVAASQPDTSQLAQRFGVPEIAVDENDVGRSEYRGGRVRLLWTPTDDVNVTVNYLTQDLEQDGLPDVESGLGDFRQTRLQLIDPIGGGEKLVDDFDLGNVVIKYNWQWGEIISSTSAFNEFALRNSELSEVLFGSADERAPTSQTPTREADVFIEEIRFISNFEGSFQMLTGLYYEDNKRIGKVFVVSADDPVNGIPSDVTLLLDLDSETRTTQAALFGDLTYELNNDFTFSVGARYYDYTRSDHSRSQGRFVDEEMSTPDNSRAESSESGINTSANITYTPDQNSLIYVQYSEGFRLGGPQLPVPVETCDIDGDGFLDNTNVPIDTPGFESDQLKSMELGIKFSSLANRLVINGSIYQNDWNDIPVGTLGQCAVQIVVNAGEAKTQGIDVESDFYITPNIRLSSGLSFIDAELSKDVDILNASKGNRLAGSARYSLNMALQYDFEFMNNDGFFRIDYSRDGGFYGDLLESGPELGNYNLFHIKTGINYGDISMEFYINNLTNTNYLIWADNNTGFTYPQKPRTFGVDFIYHF